MSLKRCISGGCPRSGSSWVVSFSRNATSVISPRSISKSGFSPLASLAACIALPSVSEVMPVLSWKAMKDWTRGLVRTPPKSETTTSMPDPFSGIAPHHLVMPEALAALDRPAEEGDVRIEPRPVHGAGADQRAGAPHGLAGVADP